MFLASLTPDLQNISVRLAQSADEVAEAQRVRYSVFYEEYGAIPTPEMQSQQRDYDAFDDYADHLIVLDHASNTGEDKIVGTYRLLRQSAADLCGRFYSSDEFDIAPILSSGLSLLELGRSCVLPDYRTRPVLQMLWQGIADYITDHTIDLMFGCASLHSTVIDDIAAPLSYLYHYHLSPTDLRPRALDARFVDMNILPKDQINAKRVFAALPPIIKGYLRLGGTIGDGAVIDMQFNTTDVCVVVQTHLLTERYRNHYERKIQKPMAREISGAAAFEDL